MTEPDEFRRIVHNLLDTVARYHDRYVKLANERQALLDQRHNLFDAIERIGKQARIDRGHLRASQADADQVRQERDRLLERDEVQSRELSKLADKAGQAQMDVERLDRELRATMQYADSRDALVERMRKENEQAKKDAAALLWEASEVARLRKERDAARKKAAQAIEDFDTVQHERAARIEQLRKERDHEARVAKQRGKALDLALSDLNRALGRVRRLEAAIREHRAWMECSCYYTTTPPAPNLRLWEVLDG